MSDAAVLNDPNDALDSAAVAESAGPACEKCQKPIASDQTTVCPHCGWYASAGMFVEIEPQWEAAVAGQASAGPKKSHLQVWLGLLPGWAWCLIGLAAATLGGSAAVRLLVEDETLRTTWAIYQLLGGAAVAAVCHFVVFVAVIIESPDMGLGDLVMRPLRAWLKLLSQMPRRFWLASLGDVALCGAVGAAAIIGGIPYERLLDWDIKPRPQKSLLSSIAGAMPAGGDGDMTMEEAMEAFADNAAVEGNGEGDGGGSDAEPTERMAIDAVILGYELDKKRKLHTLLVAAELDGKLYYAGRVIPNMPWEESSDLLRRLRKVHAKRPIVNAPEGAQWVEPRLTCLVSFDEQLENGMLRGIQWEKLHGWLKLPW